MKGTVKNYNNEKGYGFIFGDDGNDYFFHVSQLKAATTKSGDCVDFTPGKNDKGLCANNVVLTECAKDSKIIVIGEIRIRVNNIKMYSIVDSRYASVPVYKRRKEMVHTTGLFGKEKEKNKYYFDFIKYQPTTLERNTYGLNPSTLNGFYVEEDGELTFNDYGDLNSLEYIVNEIAKRPDKEILPAKTLVITTYQGNQYHFEEAEYDIYSAIKELDGLMG